MRSRQLITSILAAAIAGAGIVAITAARRGDTIERVDFGVTRRSTRPVYDARLTPASKANVKEFTIPIVDDTVEIADGVKYAGWTFGGTVPGPVIRVRQGDLVRIKVVNKANMPHSIDFHAARIPASVAYRAINPGDSVSFEFTAKIPGAFLVHCGTPPVTMHIMQGMYFPIIVDPKDGWGTKADKEFVIVQSEFYTKTDSLTQAVTPDWSEAMAKDPTYVVFNGKAAQYKANPLKVDVGDRVRFFVVNAGPNSNSDFHIVGNIFDRVYPDGDPSHALEGVQTYTVPAGGGVVFEAVFDKDGSGEGLYPFVTHSFSDAEKGAVGIIQVGVPKAYAHMDH